MDWVLTPCCSAATVSSRQHLDDHWPLGGLGRGRQEGDLSLSHKHRNPGKVGEICEWLFAVECVTVVHIMSKESKVWEAVVLKEVQPSCNVPFSFKGTSLLWFKSKITPWVPGMGEKNMILCKKKNLQLKLWKYSAKSEKLWFWRKFSPLVTYLFLLKELACSDSYQK